MMSISLSDLTTIRLFTGLPHTVLEQIASRLEECFFLSGAVILTRHAPADALFFIISGKVRVELNAAAGQIFNLAELGSWAQHHQREEHEHRDVITNVIGWQLLPEFGAFPGSSPWFWPGLVWPGGWTRSGSHLIW